MPVNPISKLNVSGRFVSSIGTRLVLLCFAVATPLLVIGTFIIWKEYKTLKHEAKRATTIQAAIATRTLAHWMSSNKDSLESLASLPGIAKLNRRQAAGILALQTRAQTDWLAAAITDRQGRVTASSSRDPLSPDVDLRKLSFFKRILKTGNPAMSGYLRCPLTGKPAVLMGTPVKVRGRVRGVVIASIKPQAVANLFRGLGEASGSVITVVDNQNTVVTRTIDNSYWMGRDFSHAKTVKAAKLKARGTLEAVGVADPTRRAYAYQQMPDNGWLVIAGVPTQVIYGPHKDRLIIVVALAFCAVGLSVILGYAATRYFTKPIYDLVKEAVAIGRGDLSKRVEIRGSDEFALLSRAFNEMATSLELNNELKHMVDRISEAIRKSLDLDQVLNTTVSEMGRALAASRCCLALIDARGPSDLADDMLTFNHVWWDPARRGSNLTNRCVRMTENSILRTILEQGSILTMDVLDAEQSTPLFEGEQDCPDEWQSIKSLLACPISTVERPLGLILIHQVDERRTWTDMELELVEAIGRHVALAIDHAYLYAQSKTLAEQELMINHIVKAVRGSLDLDTILTTVTKELGHAISADRCQIAQPRKEGPLIVTHEYHKANIAPMTGLSVYSAEADFEPRDTPGSVLGIDLEKLCHASTTSGDTTLNDAPLAVITSVREDRRCERFRNFLSTTGTESLMVAPLLDDHRILGLLMVHQCDRQREWKPVEMSLVTAIADQVAVAISHANLFAQVKQQSITDGLTGLYNHVYLKNRLAQEISRCRRKNSTLSLLMVDLDYLKQINDNYGHPVGDDAIRKVAWTLRNLLRSGDTAARYGGEEFAVILPETGLTEAELIATRLCRQINSASVPGAGSISASIGLASFPAQAGDMPGLIEKADQALYVAKNKGRNQVSVYNEFAEEVIPPRPQNNLSQEAGMEGPDFG